MFTIKDLAGSLGLSTSQIRRRLSALDGLIDNHMKRGRKSKILVDSSGFELLERLETLRKEGLTTDEAVEAIEEELRKNDGDNHRQPSEKEDLLKDQIKQLQSEVQYLRKKLDEKDRQIQQLLPAPTEEENGKKDGFKDLSLIQIIKKWFTTKT